MFSDPPKPLHPPDPRSKKVSTQSTPALEGHFVDRIFSGSVAGEDQFLSVRRPLRRTIVSAVACQAQEAGTVGIHQIDLEISIAVTGERDAASVGREGGFHVVAR